MLLPASQIFSSDSLVFIFFTPLACDFGSIDAAKALLVAPIGAPDGRGGLIFYLFDRDLGSSFLRGLAVLFERLPSSSISLP